MEITRLDHIPIRMSILVEVISLNKITLSSLRLMFLTLHSSDFHSFFYHVWILVPFPIRDRHWMLWWEATI